LRVTDRAAHLPPLRPRRLRRDESGAALLEFSLVFLLFALMLYGLIAFGMILATKQRITSAASGAARAAVGAASDGEAVSRATQRVEDALGAPGSYTPNYATAPCNTAVPTGPRCITVTITWDYENHPIVPPAPGLGLVTPDEFGATAVVQFSN
jgi:Flp pilus assembly protein TadG